MIKTSGDYWMCQSCVDCMGKCLCKQSEYYGVADEELPWGGCKHFLSKRKWSVDGEKKRKKRKKKWPSLAEFEFGE